MGRSKLDLDLGGLTVLERSVNAFLGAPFDAVVVVTAAGATHRLPEDERLRVVTNPRRGRGMGSSLRAGLEALPANASVVAVGLGDEPLLRSETVARLLEAQRKDPERIAFPVHQGKRGHPVLWPARFVPELLAVSGDRGARDLLERHAGDAVAVPVEDAGVRLDIDSPRDYARAKALVEGEGPLTR